MAELQPFHNNEAENQQIVQYEDPIAGHGPVGTSDEGGFDILGMLKRRWLIIALVFIPIAAGGVGAAFFLIEEQYKTQAAIEVAPIVPSILYSNPDSERPLPNYDAFKNTQAVLMGSDVVLNRVVEDLHNQNLHYFDGVVDYRMALREAVEKKDIEITPQPKTNLIVLSMTSSAKYYREAEKILNSIVQNYTNIAVGNQQEGENVKLTNLDTERKKLQEEMESQREAIRKLVSEFGSSELTPRQQMMFEQVASLQKELITVNIRKMALETQVMTQKNAEPNEPLSYELLSRKNAIIQSDPSIQALISDIRRYEEMVNTAQQNMVETHPELIRRKEMLQTLRGNYEKKLQEVTQQVEGNLVTEQQRSRQRKMADIEAEYQQICEYEKKLTEKISQQDLDTIQMGRRQLNIDDQREELEQTKNRYNDVVRRIDEINIESKRPARISVYFMANSVPVQGKLKKIAAGAVFAALALSFGLAFLLEKMDKRVHEPEEVVRRIGVRIIGTTTNPSEIKRPLLAQQMVDDYQTIRANLALLNGEGHRIITVSSAGKGDGKTTFSINLATSFARSGQKTLLIDGDLRKPDIAYRLDLPEHARGLQDYLFGTDIHKAVIPLNGDGLFILAADERNAVDAADLLSQKSALQRIRALAEHFDVVIIDTPPVLAFADALLWGKMSDGVVLVSFVGKTSHPEMKQALDRLNQSGVKILGTVVNNVHMHHNYRRYGYGYGYAYGDKTASDRQKVSRKRSSEHLLLSHGHKGQDGESDMKT